jgi:transposase InsO family protein
LEVIDTLADVMLGRGIPEHIRSDNGPEFIAHELQQWLAKVGTPTLYIERGSPWENGYCLATLSPEDCKRVEQTENNGTLKSKAKRAKARANP